MEGCLICSPESPTGFSEIAPVQVASVDSTSSAGVGWGGGGGWSEGCCADPAVHPEEM